MNTVPFVDPKQTCFIFYFLFFIYLFIYFFCRVYKNTSISFHFVFQRIEEPFLEAVKLTLADRYTDNMDAIYKVLIKFILQTMVNAINKDISNGPNNVS